jgi:hypothetical protein
MRNREQFEEGLRRSAEARARMEVHEASFWKRVAELEEMLAAAGYPVRKSAPPPETASSERGRVEPSMRQHAEVGAQVKRMTAANGPAPPARPVRRAARAITPASGNWSVMTGDPSVHVDVEGSFVL